MIKIVAPKNKLIPSTCKRCGNKWHFDCCEYSYKAIEVPLNHPNITMAQSNALHTIFEKYKKHEMKLKKGSKEAKEFMASIRAKKKGAKKVTVKKLAGVKKAPVKKATVKKRPLISKHKDIKSHNVKISIGDLFDTNTINSLDDLKKQYFKLAKQYHPDAGGTTAQFQELQKNYEAHFKTILNGGTLDKEQRENEIVIDKAIRDIINNLINLEGLKIEVIGKWLWVGGDTYPLRTILKGAGLTFIKKGKEAFWVYKGVEASSRGKMSIEDIRKTHGSTIVKAKPSQKLNGIIISFNRTKVATAFKKLTKGLNKRYK